MNIIIQSFGYKKSGIPANSNLVFDVRGLPNPHDVAELKELKGTDYRVGEWLKQFAATDNIYESILNSINTTIRWHSKNELVVSIGCYGGKHRSQYIAARLANDLERNYLIENIIVKHLEM